MWFEISLLYILFAINTLGQDNYNVPVRCLGSNIYVEKPFPPLLFILQTSNPILGSWEAVIVALKGTGDTWQWGPTKIGLDFDIPVEVYLEAGDTRTKLEYQYYSGVTPYGNSLDLSTITHYMYDNKGKNIEIFKINVRNPFNNTTPYLTVLGNLDYSYGNDCLLMVKIPYEKIGDYKITHEIDERKNWTILADNNAENSDLEDLKSHIKNRYGINIIHEHTDQNITTKSSCGIRIINHNHLITNGYSARHGNWPWHAALYHTKGSSLDYKCGGSLITRNAVLTAAHCVYNTRRTSILIRQRIIIKLGLHNKFIGDSNTQGFGVHQIIPHEKFNINNLKNDIAILQLDTQAMLSEYVQPVCLWLKENSRIREEEVEEGYVVGWGVNEKYEDVNDLTEARMPIVSHQICLDSHDGFLGQFLTADTFCAGKRNGTSACNGDSGGGMFLQDDDGIFRIRGIVSVDKPDKNTNYCNPNEYIIFTNVGRYVDWIENTISTNF